MHRCSVLLTHYKCSGGCVSVLRVRPDECMNPTCMYVCVYMCMYVHMRMFLHVCVLGHFGSDSGFSVGRKAGGDERARARASAGTAGHSSPCGRVLRCRHKRQ